MVRSRAGEFGIAPDRIGIWGFSAGGHLASTVGETPDPKLIENLSNEKQVTAGTPPTFLFHTNEDTGVPPENSVLFYLALRARGVPAEMHIYERGRHGVGLAAGDPILSTWADRLEGWLRTRGLLKDDPAARNR